MTLTAGFGAAQAPSTVDAAFAAFWSAKSPQEATTAADAVVKSGITFDEAYARLQRGRTYSPDVPRGVVRLKHHLGPYDFNYLVEVPANYDPAKRYQVRIQLHGGVSREDPNPRGNGIGALAGAEQIYVMPTAWADSPWWHTLQVDNLRAIVDTVKRTYNVDENRVAMAGVSDGATGAYYFAMRDTTPYSSFLPLNGFLMVLSNRGNGIEGELYANNLLNKPFFVVNGGMDPLYPAAYVSPYTDHLKRHGVDLTYTLEPEAGHNTAWWPEVKASFESFVRDHPRRPHPETLTWETNLEADSQRAHWLVVDELGTSKPEVSLPDLNDGFGAPPLLNFGADIAGTRVIHVTSGSNADAFGLRALDVVTSINGHEVPSGTEVLEFLSTFISKSPMTIGVSRDGRQMELRSVFDPGPRPTTIPLFSHQHQSGRVDLVRDGNTVRAITRGVGSFTLLISPDAFDFARPVKVVADGRTVFDGIVKKDVATLMKWAARDNDRAMLYGAEIHVKR